MRENLELTLYADAAELVVVVAKEAIDAISHRLNEKGICHFALTGGSLGNEFAKKLVENINNSGDLTGLNIWFSDERFDSADSPLRNSRPVRDGLINASVAVHEVKSTDDGMNVDEAAADYVAELRGLKMDICVLGLGPDGHVASLFPNHWNPESRDSAIAIADSPKPPDERVSFSMAFINSSEQVWIIASGVHKAAAVKEVLAADVSVPAGHVQAAGLTRLLVDTAAFSH